MEPNLQESRNDSDYRSKFCICVLAACLSYPGRLVVSQTWIRVNAGSFNAKSSLYYLKKDNRWNIFQVEIYSKIQPVFSSLKVFSEISPPLQASFKRGQMKAVQSQLYIVVFMKSTTLYAALTCGPVVLITAYCL